MNGLKILGILGSPRRGGNTDILLDRSLKAAEKGGAETQKFILNSMSFRPCQECSDITKDGRCKVRDDMQTIYPAVEDADAIILASPIFFGSISAQTKMMIDRFQCQWLGINFFKSYTIKKKKCGAFLCVEASDRQDFLLNAKAIVKNFFVTVGASYSWELFCKNLDDKGAVLESISCIEQAEDIGRLAANCKKKESSL